jgi:predicted site-specific integrase-resolvase
MSMLHTTAVQERRHVSTDEFADRMLVLRQTVLKAYSRDGAYCGIRPVRLPNRRLAWPENEIEKLFETHNPMTSVKEAA